MRRRSTGIALTMGLLLVAALSHAQKATEQFIPVGQSPGVSGVLSYQGELREVDRQNRTVTVGEGDGAHTTKVTDDTDIWLDRSESGKTSLTGGMEDLEPGRRVEIKYVDVQTKDVAEWIKVVVPAGGR